MGGHHHHPSSHVLLGDGCVALAVVEVPRLVVELGFDDELGELARVLVAVEDEEEVVDPHDELGELALVLVVGDAEEHCLAPCGEEDVEPHAQWAALLLLGVEEARHDYHVADVDDHVDDDALVDLRVLHVDGDLVRPLRMLHLLLKEHVDGDGLGGPCEVALVESQVPLVVAGPLHVLEVLRRGHHHSLTLRRVAEMVPLEKSSWIEGRVHPGALKRDGEAHLIHLRSSVMILSLASVALLTHQ